MKNMIMGVIAGTIDDPYIICERKGAGGLDTLDVMGWIGWISSRGPEAQVLTLLETDGFE